LRKTKQRAREGVDLGIALAVFPHQETTTSRGMAVTTVLGQAEEKRKDSSSCKILLFELDTVYCYRQLARN